MSKPILFILYISLASTIGFVGGVYFGTTYKKDVVLETITEYDNVRELLDWYGLIVSMKLNLENLERTKSLEELEEVKSKYKSSGLSHISIFRKHAEKVKSSAKSFEAIIELEESVNDMERYFH
ncbi:MAG: hypothetical protein KZQ75_04150 [Candidatus Thiodiazotropha sp. (ex Myrtea spinifera)]|nr:hypothetical protein [Candidatus Thiodiazotropha sp. (ex Myrtea spinifera)]